MKTHSQLDMCRERMQEIVGRLDVVEVLLRGEENFFISRTR